MNLSIKKRFFPAMNYPLAEQIPIKYRLAVGLTPCLMFAMTGIVGYGTTNVLPEIVGKVGTVALYSMITLMIQVVSAAASPLAGSLGDLLGRKVLIIGCLIPFTVSVILIGLSVNPFMLCSSLLVMNISFSICQTSTSAMIYDAVDGALMSTLMGIRHSAGQVAFLLGPIVAGTLTTLYGVRLAYLIMAPLGIFSLILIICFTPNLKSSREHFNLDWSGITFLCISMTSISILLASGGVVFPWISVESLLLIVFFIGGGYLVIKTELKANNPILDLAILEHKEMVPILVYKMLMQTSNGAFGAYLILYCQKVMGLSPVETGLFGLARLAAVFGSSYVGIWIARKKCLNASVQLATFLSFVSGIILLFIYPQMPLWLLMAAHILMALNTSFGTIPLTLVPAIVLPKEKVGNGFGIFYFSENLGSVLGTAAAALVVNIFGDISVSYRYIALSFVFFSVLRFIYTVLKFSDLKEVLREI